MQTASVNLAITFTPASPFLIKPSSLTSAHPALHHLQYTKLAGELSDVLVFTVLHVNDGVQRNEILQALKSVESVLRVDVVEPRKRTKRDEF